MREKVDRAGKEAPAKRRQHEPPGQAKKGEHCRNFGLRRVFWGIAFRGASAALRGGVYFFEAEGNKKAGDGNAVSRRSSWEQSDYMSGVMTSRPPM